MTLFNWRPYLWLLLSTVLIPAVLTLTVGILILVFYRESWDVAFGVLVLCFAVFALVGSLTTVFLVRRSARLARLQSEFIANISHDFRTPLTSIRLFVETLRAGRATEPEEQRRCLDHLAQETERMDRLVQQVLTFGQLERAPRITADALAACDTEELVARALEPYALDAARAARIERVVEPNLPRVLANAEAVVEAVRNLIDNALKYSSLPGPIVVTLRSDGEGIAIAVRDPGPPIPASERRRVFRRFYRIPGTRQPGTGLGLAIAAQTARTHGGNLELKSSAGTGNTFVLRLPLAVPALARRAAAQPAPAGGPD